MKCPEAHVADHATEFDLLPDELALARAQIDSGLPALAEPDLRRLVAELEAAGSASAELDECRALLAQALWLQQRPQAAGAVLTALPASSEIRERPLIRIIQVDALAASGQLERAGELAERLLSEAGDETVWDLRSGVPSRFAWRDPPRLTPAAPTDRPGADAAAEPGRAGGPGDAPRAPGAPLDDRAALARLRLHAARAALDAGDGALAVDELSLALRLDASVADDALPLVERMLPADGEPETARLVLYGDVLAAAGRSDEAAAAYDRAARAITR